MKASLLTAVIVVLVIKIHGQGQLDGGKLSGMNPIALRLIQKACEGVQQTEATPLLNEMVTILGSLEHGRSKRSVEDDLDLLSRSLIDDEDEEDETEDDLELDARVFDDDEEFSDDVDDDKKVKRIDMTPTKKSKSESVDRIIRQLKLLKKDTENHPPKKSEDKVKDRLVRQLRYLYDLDNSRPKQLYFIIKLLLSAHKNMQRGNQVPHSHEHWNWNEKITALRKTVQHLNGLLLTGRTNVQLEIVCGTLKHAMNKN